MKIALKNEHNELYAVLGGYMATHYFNDFVKSPEVKRMINYMK